METNSGSQRSGWLTVANPAKVLWFVYAGSSKPGHAAAAFTLRLLGANPAPSLFTDWVYRSVARIPMAPFRGCSSHSPSVISRCSTCCLLFAVIIYSLAALFLRSAIDWVTKLRHATSQGPDGGNRG